VRFHLFSPIFLAEHITLSYLVTTQSSYTNYETSLQSVIEHAGDLEIIYRTLVNEVSDISSAKSVFLDARSADQTLNVGDAGTRIQLEENQLLRTATPHQGVTAIWDRNGHTSLIRGKQGISGTL